MSAIFIDDQVVHYEVLGRGRPLLFVHGWVGSWRYWLPAMQAASTGYRAYALDLWGFGDSAKDPARYPLEQQVALLDRFLSELGIPKVALIGHGLGAVAALLFAQQYPYTVERAVLAAYPRQPGQMHERLASEPPAELAKWLLPADEASRANQAEAAKADPVAIQTGLTSLEAIDLGRLQHERRGFSLFVHGRRDPLVNLSLGENNLPSSAHRIVFEDSGHFPMLDAANSFNRLLVDFLALENGQTPRQLQLKEEWKRRVR